MASPQDTKPFDPAAPPGGRRWSRLLSQYGMLLVLALLCAVMSLLTIDRQHPNGAAAGEQFAAQILKQLGPDKRILVAAGNSSEDVDFAEALAAGLRQSATVAAVVTGTARDARRELAAAQRSGQTLDLVACNDASSRWAVWEFAADDFPRLGPFRVVKPSSYYWPTFLKTTNILNIVNNAAVIAIIGIGMTMVIVTGGIDLSVGSLVALAAVISTLLLRDAAGGPAAGAAEILWCGLAAVAACGLLGACSGAVVLTFNTRPFVVPPFIMTLSMMMIARGMAYMISGNETIPAAELPESFNWLGGGSQLGPVPNPIVLMAVLFVAAHVVMSRTTLGRYIYAVGGNMEAARLSGVPVKRVLLLVYTTCGLLSGLGGVVLASRLSSGSAQYGLMYELHIIAAVVVGGASLSGGEGKVVGTLVGALIIAVVQSGLNQQGISGREQDLVLGLIILAAVLLDMLARRARQRGG